MDAQCLLLILNGKLGQDAGHTACEHRLARSRRPDHEQAEFSCRRKRHAAFSDFLPQHVCIVELGIQVVPCGIAHAVSKLRQMRDKAAIHAREWHMLVGPTGDKRQPHVASQ